VTTTMPRVRNRHRPGVYVLLVVVSLEVAGCGSDGQPATAQPASEFCKLAQEARDIGDKVDPSSGDPALSEQQVAAALTASKAAAAKAPKDFAEIGERSVKSQEALVVILEEYDYEWVAAITSDEGQKLFEDPQYEGVQAERDTYLLAKCEIQPTDNTYGGGLTFSPGDAGIRELFALLQLTASFELTDEQVGCAVDALSGTISDEDVQAIANQQTVSEEGTAAFLPAVSSCGIEFPDS